MIQIIKIAAQLIRNSRSSLFLFFFFKIKVCVFRIFYVSANLSNKLDKNKILNIKKKFKTNKFGTFEKIFSNITKVHNNKKNLTNSILFDSLINKQ